MALEASVAYSNGIVGGNTTGGREGTSAVFAYSHSLTTPFDPSTGTVEGQGEHSPVTITKPLDPASTALLQAWSQGTTLDDVTVNFYRVTATGTQEVYFEVKLSEVLVVEIRHELLNTNYPENDASVPREHVSFLYNRATWKYPDGGFEYEDEWKSAL